MNISSLSNKEKQKDYIDDRLLMYADDSSTFITTTDQIGRARKNIHTYKKSLCSKLYDGNKIIMKN